MFAVALLALLLPALVSAHGYVAQVTIDGTVYKGNSPGSSSSTSSVIRQVANNSPVKGTTNPDLNCGASAQVAADVADANPGSQVLVQWVGGTTPDGSSWPHNVGPIMHYMAKCDGSCSSYQSANAEWFKISELGLEPGSQTWYQSQIQSGAPANVTIPSTLASGNYLLRSEIISLQLAATQGGAEFYPACIQLNVGGSQTGGPQSSEEVKFPGGYSDTDPGILVPNIYNPPITYTFPGPAVAAFVSGGSNSSGSGSSSSTPGSTGSGSSTPAPSPSATAPSTSPSSSPAANSLPAVPSTPANVGASPSSSSLPSASSPATSPTSSPTSSPTPTSSSGGSSSCKRRKRSVTTSGSQVKARDSSKARMHRRRLQSARRA
ncbi:glycosyl hydrolase family 61-domain-containing protein [Phlebopus sp. FC_14]|nr:glycosyl hydrolase family 61-domain-containing protein [Phlebopus sp. FC_14]